MLNKTRLSKLTQIMNQENIECSIIAPSGDMNYLLDFNPGGCERFQALFVLQDQRIFYITNKLYFEDMKNALPKETKMYVWDDSEGWYSCIKKAFRDFNLESSTIMLNSTVRASDLLDMQGFFGTHFVNGIEILENYRAIKSTTEIELMKDAAIYADEVMDEIKEYIEPGKTEKEIKNKILDLFSGKGVTPSFEPIVASGSNNSRPHYNGDDRIISEKDVVLLDFGCVYKGYCSDTSRTFFVGDITSEEEKLYNIVLRALKAAAEYAKEGVTAGDVDKKARDIIEMEGYGDCFLNRTGHGIGFDVHEAPYIRGGSEQILEKGMAFSIEPGIYIADKIGIRIEDIIIINQNGEGESINRSTKNIVIL